MRCPLRMKAFDKPDTCDPDCALLVHVTHWDDYELRTVDDGVMCAITATAVQGGFTVEPLNTMEVDDGSEAGE